MKKGYSKKIPIADGNTVFFSTYRVEEDNKIYADFIEPYFKDLADLAFFNQKKVITGINC